MNSTQWIIIIILILTFVMKFIQKILVNKINQQASEYQAVISDENPEKYFICEQTQEMFNLLDYNSFPWITKNHPCPDGEIFDDPDGWKLRVWIPGQIHKRTYLSNFTYDTRKDAEDSMDWFIKIGKNKSDFKD